jgi:hypothetical protein
LHPTRPPVQPTAERNTRPFLRAFGFALPVVAIIVVWAVTSYDDPEAAGEFAGGLSVAPLLGGLAVGIWAMRSPRRWFWPDYALRFLLCTLGFFGLNAVGRGLTRAATPSAPVFVALTDAEKDGLSLGGGWVRHRQFGFTIPVGDKVDVAPQIQEAMNQQLGAVPGTFAWAFQHQTDGVILVYVAKGPGGDRETFSGLARGLGKGTAQHAATVLEEVVQWDRGGREFRFAARMTDGQYTRVRCVPSDPNRKPPYVVCVQTLTADSTGLADARSYLKVPTWR